ncbi:MAG: DNA mismatch repair protein MutS, partial [Planctomycetales bacterium]|nr:DNA mismatch repair protein MutS [Planctomycetales bacterium]
MSTVSPMMQQYQDAKALCGEALLLFRMGDFYELFYDDAKIAAEAVGLTLTSRDKGTNPIPMAGFPHHQLEGYLGKLIQGGYRVAICEQVEDPKKAKGLVKREVTRVVTPGTLTDDNLLDPRQSNYLVAVSPPGNSKKETPLAGVAWVELSTGQFMATSVAMEKLADHLMRIAPSECLLPDSAKLAAEELYVECMVTRRPDWAFGRDVASKTLAKHFQTNTLEGFGYDKTDQPAIQAAGAVIDYLIETQKASLAHIDRVVPYRSTKTLDIDQATRRSLELTRTIRDGNRAGSLLAVMDRTVTAMGARLLGEWLASPLTEIDEMNRRFDCVEELAGDESWRAQLREELRGVYDLQRLLTRVTTGRATPRDLGCVGQTLGRLPQIKTILAGRHSRLLQELDANLDLCPDIYSQLQAALKDELPLVSRDGGMIRDGFDQELDELRQLA